MGSKNMTAVERTGTSSKIKEQHEKHEKFVGHFLKKEPVLRNE